MLTKISAMLDDIADRLEAKGLTREAYEIDRIADKIDGRKQALELSQIPKWERSSGGGPIKIESDFKLDVENPDTKEKVNIPNGETIDVLGQTIPQDEIVIRWKEKVLFIKDWNDNSGFGKFVELMRGYRPSKHYKTPSKPTGLEALRS